jgi:pentose-5-phosphate-3-epimerase
MDQKVRRIRAMTNLPKGEDGAIAAQTAPLVVGAGAQGLVAGSAIYTGDPVTKMCKITEAWSHTARRWQIARYRKVHPYFVGGGEPYAESG